MTSPFTALVDSIIAATGRPMTDTQRRHTREKIIARERKLRIRNFKRAIKAGIEELHNGPLTIKDDK